MALIDIIMFFGERSLLLTTSGICCFFSRRFVAWRVSVPYAVRRNVCLIPGMTVHSQCTCTSKQEVGIIHHTLRNIIVTARRTLHFVNANMEYAECRPVSTWWHSSGVLIVWYMMVSGFFCYGPVKYGTKIVMPTSHLH